MQQKNMYSNAINKKMENAKWNWSSLSYNKNITWEIVKENMNKPWNWYGLSRNNSITWEIVKDNIERPWDWLGDCQGEYRETMGLGWFE